MPRSAILARSCVELAAVFAAELVVDRLELLAQVVLALITVDLVAHAVLDAPLERGDLDLRGEVDCDVLEPAQRIRDLEQRLAARNIGQELGGQEIGEMTGIGSAVHHVLNFDRQCAARVGEAVGQILDVGDEGARLGRGRFRFVERFRDDGVKPGLVGEITDLDAADALQNDLDVAGRLAFRRDDRDERADVMEILGPRIVGIGIAMGGHDQPPVGGQGMIDGSHRSGATNEQGDDVAREDDDVLERQERMPVLEPLPRIHGAHASVLCMRKCPSAGRIACVVRARPTGRSRPLMVAGY